MGEGQRQGRQWHKGKAMGSWGSDNTSPMAECFFKKGKGIFYLEFWD